MILFESIFTTFRGSWGSNENQLEPKTLILSKSNLTKLSLS